MVIKFARWAFEKFKGVEDKLGTQMRAVGEVMSIGKTYKEAFQKAIRSLETGRYGLGHAKDFDTLPKEELLRRLATPSSERHFMMYEAIRKGATVEEIFDITKVKHYFIEQMKELVEEEEAILAYKGKMLPDDMLISAKKNGFADKYLSQLLDISEEELYRTARSNCERFQPIKVRCMEELLYELCQAKFLVPLYMDRPPLPKEGGGMEFSQDTFIGFRSLKMPNDESQVVFPAFTDEVATMLWKDAFQEDQPKQFATMQLPHLMVEVDRGHAGLVINPFGPVSVYLPKELLSKVERSEVFEKRYVRPVVLKQQEQATEE